MSIQRWDIYTDFAGSLYEDKHPTGKWVTHDDHVAEVERLDRHRDELSADRHRHLLEIRALDAETERLRALVRELADDLEARIKAEYGHALRYKHMRLGYGAEMSLVREARAALEGDDG